jgi:hypothetical protein
VVWEISTGQTKQKTFLDRFQRYIEQEDYKSSRLEQVLQCKYFSLYDYRIFEGLLFPNFERMVEMGLYVIVIGKPFNIQN